MSGKRFADLRSRAEGDAILSQVSALPITRHTDGPLVLAAFDIADQTGRTVYDSMYIALATLLGCEAVTADQRLFNSLSTSAWTSHIRWVADVL